MILYFLYLTISVKRIPLEDLLDGSQVSLLTNVYSDFFLQDLRQENVLYSNPNSFTAYVSL